MTTIQVRHDFDVALIDSMGDDSSVVKSARVSTVGAKSLDSSSDKGLINFLMKNKHLSPFEHASLTFLISAPIFVFREFMRHRTWSYNEESGRYRELQPVVYVPARDRALNQQGKVGHYTFTEGTDTQYDVVGREQVAACARAFESYQRQLNEGVAREVARMCLPVSTYSSMYATANLRNVLQFLELRNAPEAMWEIREVAKLIEEYVRSLFPIVWETWKNSR